MLLINQLIPCQDRRSGMVAPALRRAQETRRAPARWAFALTALQYTGDVVEWLLHEFKQGAQCSHNRSAAGRRVVTLNEQIKRPMRAGPSLVASVSWRVRSN
ncbi:hypothetical protein CYL20_26545 [Pseudomonas palleroniana]|uniref:Uncharacterized protein n=1 Tax=Pseudomonas palleroniana TaxID=191390 RepID=A0A2L1JHK3_9PSED|nr:hypothetical protein CYL20_26545 [Pseudomonas palleroniana]